MKTDLKFVFDTNVIVSGFFFPKSLPRAALYSASEIGQILYSRGTLDELWDVIMRPKFDRYLPLAARAGAGHDTARPRLARGGVPAELAWPRGDRRRRNRKPGR